jgi:hypothetical protein
MLKLDTTQAAAADNITAQISVPGKYIGTITRAEKLVSKDKGTQGLGLSFRADNGQTAEYLDLYHTKGTGEPLTGLKTVNAVMCCAKVKQAEEGTVQVEKWDNVAGARRKMGVTGYPALMNKRIGLLLRKTLETDAKNGKDRERLEIFGVFDPETELTASEILSRATEPQKLSAMLDVLIARGVIDKRTSRPQARQAQQSAGMDRFDGVPDFDSDIPF